jgi:GNAT superfamily N-acetyltransferase
MRSRYIGNISQPVVYSRNAVGLDRRVELRSATSEDAEACLAVQRLAALTGYAHIFPQADYPFPDHIVAAEWVARLASDADVIVADIDGEIVGTISARPPWLEALFVIPAEWGTGIAAALHDAALERISAAHCEAATLDVMVDNLRARRFYERRAWAPPDGRTQPSPFPPHPPMLGYRRELSGAAESARRATIEG